MKLRKKKRQLPVVEELDITSLLDILVILLLFLLQNFNDSEVSIDVVEQLTLPYSHLKDITHNAVVIQVNLKQDLYFNGLLIGNLKDEGISSIITKELGVVPKELKGNKLVNLLFDKNLEYKEINKILRIVDENGFNKYKLVVQGD